MLTLFGILGLLAFGSIAAVKLTRGMSAGERTLVPIAVSAHLIAAFAHVWIVRNVYGSGDMTMYWEHGQLLASVLGSDPATFWDSALRLIFQDPDVRLPVVVYGRGTSTGTMTGIAAVMAYFLPNSLNAACVLVAMTSLSGKLLIYKALRDQVMPSVRRPVLVAVLFLPSSLFWSAGLLKEALIVLPLGLLVLGVRKLTSRASLVAFAFVIVGVISIALLKPYILVAMAFACAAWFYAHRMVARHGYVKIRPLYLGTVLAIGLGAASLLGAFFPEYALSNLSDEAERLQAVGAVIDGGSNYSLSRSGSGPLQQLQLVPLALATGLFRPFVLEASNAPMLLAALETLLLLILTVIVARRPRILAAFSRRPEAPTVVFCISFSLLMAVAVGLASTNLGTLSRYRMPMTPFLISGLLMLDAASVRKPSNSRRKALVT